MCDVWRVMCDVWCVMCDVWYVMCDVWCVMCLRTVGIIPRPWQRGNFTLWCVMCDVCDVRIVGITPRPWQRDNYTQAFDFSMFTLQGVIQHDQNFCIRSIRPKSQWNCVSNLAEENDWVSKFLWSFLQDISNLINFNMRGESRPDLECQSFIDPFKKLITCCWICSESLIPRNLAPVTNKTSNLKNMRI